MKHYDNVLDILEIQNQTVENSDATSYQLTLLNFEILVVAVLTQFLLGYLRPMSIELQSENCDLMETHVQARTLATFFLEMRENAEEAFDGLFNRACTIANKNEITINKPRTSGHQRRKANAADETVEQHFRIIFFIQLVDHIIRHINDRFSDDIKPMLYGFYLLPRYFRNLMGDIVGYVVDEYQNDITYTDDLPPRGSQVEN